METNVYGYSTKAGTFGGTLLVFFLQIHSSELLKTAVLASIGAVVSFSVSMLLRGMIRYLRGHKVFKVSEGKEK
ncbi:MAG: hypothetical protein M3004_02045 [Bacteroidota bacterium]|nr:hypothetical protein [Bacteroidota bacterium]